MKPGKGDEKELDEREKAKKLDKENLDVESTKGKAIHGPRVPTANL